MEARSNVFKGKGRRAITVGELNGLGLMHEVLHYVIDLYEKTITPSAFDILYRSLDSDLGEAVCLKGLNNFLDIFPPTVVYRGLESAEEFLSGFAGRQPRKSSVLKEMLLLWIENKNPAYDAVSVLISDLDLKKSSAYEEIIDGSKAYFETQPGFGTTKEKLLSMLLAPFMAHPESITDQLRFIIENWKDIISGSPFLMRLLNAIDLITEEGKYFLMLEQARAEKMRLPSIRGTVSWEQKRNESAPVLRFGREGTELESENFSPDLSWMPKLVIIAKNIFVWLDQLSQLKGRRITRLDEIPDDELELMSERGFTGLWLIGIWKRSYASQRIKNLNGNSEALASAYSLSSYDISPELGGQEAFENLKARALRFGVKLASDMVPNHMGIDSEWVINHPDWFLQSDSTPYRNYSYTGPDLSSDDRVGVFIEDGYWSKTDAAVVFKRIDRWTGAAKYIYHGNDGTHMPWNDTAQLDFTNPEVREAVVQAILHVARMFQIIRFDAAMVLTKKHYQRLWFPEPGTGGAIPSRSQFSMTKDQFDSKVPVEFWREVVDRVQREAPDTLLLAEAFWLMEGYFVRTLGMHRVYNSAFMNMLKKEENANYRQVVKNVLEYNPQILKRFVNFQNNPDEDTAVAQFGKDDKYFGVCVMMATMPGLPMFGHGQIEGYTEKYGMEFRRAFRYELPDGDLVSRHEREIFPLLKKREAFSEVENFVMYDFFTNAGNVNEDVFAYSNRFGENRSLVVYNNRYAFAAGWIRNSVAYRDAGGGLVQKKLSEGIGLNSRRGSYLIFRDMIRGLEYIRSVQDLEEHGLYVELDAYKYFVFMDFREVETSEAQPYDSLCEALRGASVPDMSEALEDYKLRNVHAALTEVVNRRSVEYLGDGLGEGQLKHDQAAVFTSKVGGFVRAVSEYEGWEELLNSWMNSRLAEYRALLSTSHRAATDPVYGYLSKIIGHPDEQKLRSFRVILMWILFHHIDQAFVRLDGQSLDPISKWRLTATIVKMSAEFASAGSIGQYEAATLDALLRFTSDKEGNSVDMEGRIAAVLADESVRKVIDSHWYNGVQWFNKERFEELVSYFILVSILSTVADKSDSAAGEGLIQEIGELLNTGTRLFRAAAESGYQLDSLIKILS